MGYLENIATHERIWERISQTQRYQGMIKYTKANENDVLNNALILMVSGHANGQWVRTITSLWLLSDIHVI